MRLGRQTNDPKTETVKLRLNVEMKQHIEQRSRMRGVGISDYIRRLIAEDMRK